MSLLRQNPWRRFVATPTFHVFEMYKPHHDARAIKLDVQAPEMTFRAEGQEHLRRGGVVADRDAR